jgi:hypothetical protein
MRLMRSVPLVVVAAVVATAGLGLPASAFNPDTEVTVGSPPGPFAQNKQNEPALAVNPIDTDVLVAGANEEIDLEACNAGDPTSCPFTAGVGTTGVYFSFDKGTTWIQPTYTGYSARDCLGPEACVPDPNGPIGTIPNYYENGLISDGDPALAFGPVPDGGSFSWGNGARLYATNLTGKFSKSTFKGLEALGVSRTDDVATAAEGGAAGKAAWMDPVVLTTFQSSNQFMDKEQIWADNAASSDFFGNVYICAANYRGAIANQTLDLARSTDGGDTWSSVTLVGIPGSNAGQPYGLVSGHSGCTVRTSSDGTVYVFWLGFDSQTKENGIYMARSFDGGASFETPRRLFQAVPVGVIDDVLGRLVEDGVAGARDDLADAPSVDIANDAPTGGEATDQIVLTWVDGRDGLNDEHVVFSTSTDGGDGWSELRYVEEEIGQPSDRGYYSAPAISPDGTDVYLVYNAWLEPFKDSTIGDENDRPLVGVVVHADVTGGVVDPFTELHRSPPGDARGSSQNDGLGEFLGDYVYAIATRTYGAAVWNDVRTAADCAPYDAWRMSLRTKTKKDDLPRPAANSDCPETFGDSSIWGGSYADPS